MTHPLTHSLEVVFWLRCLFYQKISSNLVKIKQKTSLLLFSLLVSPVVESSLFFYSTGFDKVQCSDTGGYKVSLQEKQLAI